MKPTDNSSIYVIVIISTLITCGLMIPVWIFIGLVVLILRMVSTTTKHTTQATVPKVIMPSNDFSDDWDYQIYPIEEND